MSCIAEARESLVLAMYRSLRPRILSRLHPNTRLF